MASTSVVFDILANDRASDKFDHLSRSVDHSGGALGKFATMAGHAAKVGAIALAGGAVLAGKGLYEMAQGAVEDQAAADKLATTLRTVAKATDGQIASVEDWITAQGKAYGVADDDLRPSLQRLAEATHDVGKAQDLASLAMDVAAAKGKPLTQVSEALMKAYNGNIGALGRLGIKTKDAEGNTISFTDATKQMADTFGGAASAHAETLAGKMDRLKLNISEAGEAIGYKLLPYVSDAADWLGGHLPGALDKAEKKAGPVFGAIVDGAHEAVDAVRPAVKEIVEALGHLTDSGSGVGDVWHDTLLPALSTTADMVGKVVNFIDELPGPVKKFGGEAAVAAVAVGSLNKALAAMKASEFVTGMRDSEKRAGALGDAARSAAGVGGILALTSAMSDSAEEADTFKHGIKLLAGGIATGLAVGGPAGAAIGGLTGLVFALKGSLTDAEGAARNLRRELANQQANDEWRGQVDSIKDSLDDLTGSTTRATRGAIYDWLEMSGIIQEGSADSRVSTRTMIDAIMGVPRALAEVKKKAPDLLSLLGGATDYLQDGRRAARDYADATYSLARRLGLTSKELQGIPKDVRIRIRNDVPDSLREIEKLGDKVGHLDRKTIKILLDAAGLPVTKKNIDAITASIVEANRAEALPTFGIDDKQFQAKKRAIQHDIRALDKEYASPKSTLSTEEYQRKRAALLKSLHHIPKRVDVRTLIKNEGVPATLNGVARVVAAHKKIDNKTIKSLIKILGIPETVAQVRKAANALDDTGKKHPNPKITVDTNAAIQDMGNVDKGMKILNKQLAKPKVELDGLPTFTQMITSAHNQLVNLDGDRADTYIVTHHQDVFEGGQHHAGGGLVTGPGGPTEDKVPASLSNGEFVERAAAVSKYGVAFMRDINSLQYDPAKAPAVPTRAAAPMVQAPRSGNGPERIVVDVRYPSRMTLRIGERDFEAAVVAIADERIDQANEFDRTQR